MHKIKTWRILILVLGFGLVSMGLSMGGKPAAALQAAGPIAAAVNYTSINGEGHAGSTISLPSDQTVVTYVNLFYKIFIPTAIGSMGIFVLSDIVRQLIERIKGKIRASTKKATLEPTRPSRTFERFHWAQRVAHALLLTSFILLGITGLSQKFAATGWAQSITAFFGGIETMRQVHHICATVLMFLAIYHLLDAGYKIFVRRSRISMLPSFQDIKDALQAFLYNLGLAKKRPQMGRYTFEEKVYYWALIWGTAIMGLTGFMMWNPIATTKLLPGEIIPAAKAIHGGEAILAVLAIVVWHMYGVLLKKFNKSMWTGKITEEEMLHEHPLELADIKAGLANRPLDAKALRKRQIVYYPIAVLLAFAMLLGIYGFTTNTKISLKTVPPALSNFGFCVPLTPTSFPTDSVTNSSGNFILASNGSVGQPSQTDCDSCHGANSITGLLIDNIANIMKGAKDGPVIIPGKHDTSKLTQIQATGEE
jgi:cytochrome b subunit of formate dehydrogenase